VTNALFDVRQTLALDNFVNIHVGWLRQYVRNMMTFPNTPAVTAFPAMGDEHCLVEPSDSAPVYKWRGVSLCFYEYCMLVQRIQIRNSLCLSTALIHVILSKYNA
jgi:hypothetical protein